MKKKVLAAALAVMTMFAFTACGQSQEPAAPNSSSDAEVSVDMDGMANPMQEMAIDEKLAEIGAEMNTPEGAEDITEYVIDGDPVILERDFTLDGMQYIVRAAKADELTDISGMYYEWDVADDETIGGMEAKCMRCNCEEETADVCLWYDGENGVTYSISTTAPDLDGFDITAIVLMIIG